MSAGRNCWKGSGITPSPSRNGKNVGEMVFLLIEEDVFSKQPEDSLDDFKGFMSFRKAFEEPYEFQDQPS